VIALSQSRDIQDWLLVARNFRYELTTNFWPQTEILRRFAICFRFIAKIRVAREFQLPNFLYARKLQSLITA